jgi:hypothetical protein
MSLSSEEYIPTAPEESADDANPPDYHISQLDRDKHHYRARQGACRNIKDLTEPSIDPNTILSRLQDRADQCKGLNRANVSDEDDLEVLTLDQTEVDFLVRKNLKQANYHNAALSDDLRLPGELTIGRASALGRLDPKLNVSIKKTMLSTEYWTKQNDAFKAEMLLNFSTQTGGAIPGDSWEGLISWLTEIEGSEDQALHREIGSSA